MVYVSEIGAYNMKVHSYYSSSGKDLILKYIDSLSVDERVDGYHVLECMEQDRMDELKIKQWEGKIWEVYFYKHNRIFYVTIHGDEIYLLHSCRKQKNKTEKTDVQTVRKRAKELESELKLRLIKYSIKLNREVVFVCHLKRLM